MRCSRRDMLRTLAGAAVASTAVGRSLAKDANTSMPIIDTHQHLWDLKKQTLPWQADAPQSRTAAALNANNPGVIRLLHDRMMSWSAGGM